MKRNILILIIISIIIFLLLLIFFFLFRSNTVVKEDGNVSDALLTAGYSETNPALGLDSSYSQPVSQVDKPIKTVSEDEASEHLPVLQKLVATRVLGAILTSDLTRLQYYDLLEKTLMSVDFLGAEPIVLATPIDSIEKIVWSPSRELFLYQAGSSFYNFTGLDSDSPIELSEQVQQPVFTDDSMRIIYQYYDLENNASNISVGTPSQNLSDFQTLTKITGHLWIKRIPGQGKVAYYLEPHGDRLSDVKAVNLNNRQEEILVSQGLWTDATWNNDGTVMAFTQLNNNGELQLYLADGDGRNARVAQKTAFVEKICWHPDGKSLYVAVPKILPKIKGFYQNTEFTEDVIYEIDLETGYATIVLDLNIDPDRKIDVRNMFLSPGGKLLFFQNIRDQSLYVLNLSMVHQDRELGEPVSVF